VSHTRCQLVVDVNADKDKTYLCPSQMPSQPRSSRPAARGPHPYVLRTQNLCKTYEGKENVLAQHVRSVITFMREQGLNLPIFLWAISWNIDELTSDRAVAAERAALMKSQELSGILSHWQRPPQTHNTGIRTKAAYDTINVFALEAVFELVGKEMGQLAGVMASPLDDLSKESLLGVHWKELASEVKNVAPTTWTLFRHIVGGSIETRQKDSETVSHSYLESVLT
jgi:hypothetical protein